MTTLLWTSSATRMLVCRKHLMAAIQPLWALAIISSFLSLAAGEGTPIKTIIDVLSESAQFSTLVGLLQRHDLVTVINQSWNSTFLAPVNSAFVGIDENTIKQEQLLYHLLREVVLEEDYAESDEGIIVPSYLSDGVDAPVRILRGEVNNGDAFIVETDLLASPQRGVVQSISDLLKIPQTMCEELYFQSEAATFTELLELDRDECTNIKHGSTVLSPSDEALNAQFSAIELNYLASAIGAADRQRVVDSCIIPYILRPQDLPAVVRTKEGSLVQLQRNLSGEVQPIEDGAWRLARDGVYAIYDGYPGVDVKFTPEMYIQALGGFNFARAVTLYGHRDLIDGSYTGYQTILIPHYASLVQDVGQHFDSSQGEESLLYQFVNEQLAENATKPRNRLLTTHMALTSGKYPQRIHYQRHSTGSIWLNWQELTSSEYRIGNTSIYTVDGALSLPPRLVMALGPFFMTSHSLTFLDQLNLLVLPVQESWTLFLPRREAWEQRLLLHAYLSQNVDALRRVFANLIIDKPLYSDMKGTELVGQLDRYPTKVTANENGFSLNGTNMEIEFSDILFDNGVAHIVNDFSLPHDLEITAQDLVAAGGRAKFLDLLRAANMDDLVRDPRNDFTLLVPSIEQLEKHNITADMPLPKLRKLLGLHVIDGNPFWNTTESEFVVTTVSDDDIEVRRVSNDVWVLSPSAGKGQRVLVTSRGDTNGAVSGSSTVLFTDRYISPDWISEPLLPPPFRLHTHSAFLIGTIFGMIIVVLLLLSGFYWLWLRGDKEEEERPLLTREDEPSNFDEGSLSENDEPGPAEPIRTPGINDDRAFGRHLDLP